MSARKRSGAVIAIAVVIGALLTGCMSQNPQDGLSRHVVVPAPQLPVNTLTAARRIEITEQQCPAAVTQEALRALPESAANAVDFLASSAQCALISTVLQAPVQPETFISPLQYTAPCTSPAAVSAWAHYDDDLIFGSPTIPNAIAAGQCIRTLFITGSDAGMGAEYALERERGIRAAYDVMRGVTGEWVDAAVTLRSGVTITTTSPVDNPGIMLLLVRLPDGGLDAGGFSATGHQSLPQLLSGALAEMTTTDTGQPITLPALEATIAEVVQSYAPQSVLAHLPKLDPRSEGDHPDHSATGNLVAGLVDNGLIDGAVVQYAIGYPSDHNAVNLEGDELWKKLEAFAAYASHDSVLHCSTPKSCLGVRKFGEWLQRQYLVPDVEIPAP
ncbi:PIG-L deacetylase family protein [Microbacterium sp. AK031]|uniref:PIG-L deacetylase family protein n=1 Tax=Microbacterium sp. AK031 TaxID=2723076 RepID=UPI002168E96A|nr:PIG-L family deacetylase [Microbacterium sp. AK031]MCS3842074.1 LmbE family N-acetylglucosaminyl deacetylase [Microbacterium sp. AK031]